MAKKMLIDATHPEETRVVVADGNKVEEFDFESINKRQLAGNIYLAKVTRVEPSLQAAFVDYGGNRHGFLAFSEIHPDYYQIPVADREALLEEEAREARAQAEEDQVTPADSANGDSKRGRRRRRGAGKEGGASSGKDDAPASRKRKRGGKSAAPSDDTPAQSPSDDTVAGLEVIEPDQGKTPGEGDAPSAPEAGDTVPPGLEIADSGTGEEDARGADATATPAPDAEEPSGKAAAERPKPTESGSDAEPGDDPEPPAGDDSGSGPKSVAEASGLDEDSVSEDLTERGERRRGSGATDPAPAHDDNDTDSGDGDRDPVSESRSEAAEPVEVEMEVEGKTQAGALGLDDVQEEVARVRARRRRRYKIQDVIKVRQILLVQVVKEERGSKGAALTTYLSLAGRYCVLMPNTARGGGISRKITNASDRKRLREIVGRLDVPQGLGLIVRTAGAERNRAEIKRDYEFLLRQWERIRDLTLKSVAPTLIYEEGSLIKRSIRDLYTKDIEAILVEGEAGYREAKDYMRMLMPSHAKHVQQYSDPIPLFIRYQAESYLNGLYSPTVQLKSGGYIVIGVTEALVAIDVNSGRSTKEGSVEETALKTNLEAAEEIARQLRLRDLAGLIVIDFIDMDEARNNRAVEKRLKDRLKMDRARLQLSRISAFGLLEMSRQRLRPGMLEASTRPCPHCQGVGHVRSDESLALAILREIEEEGVRDRSAEVTVTVPVDIGNYLINQKRAHIVQIEARYGLSVKVITDPTMASPDYQLERSKGRSRPSEAMSQVVTAESVVQSSEVDEPRLETDGSEAAGDTKEAAKGESESEASEADAEGGRGRRRRGKRGGRRRRKDKEDRASEPNSVEADDGDGAAGTGETGETAAASGSAAEAGAGATEATSEPKPEPESGPEPEAKPRRKRGGGRKPANQAAEETGAEPGEAGAAAEAKARPEDAVTGAETDDAPAGTPAPEKGAAEPAAARDAQSGEMGTGPTEDQRPVEHAAAEEDAPAPASRSGGKAERDEGETPAKPAPEPRSKRRGWWSFGF